jgi:hypothetical protein
MKNYFAISTVTNILEKVYQDVDLTTFASVGNLDEHKFVIARIRFIKGDKRYYVDARGFSPFNPNSGDGLSSFELSEFVNNTKTSIFKIHISDYDTIEGCIGDLFKRIGSYI